MCLSSDTCFHLQLYTHTVNTTLLKSHNIFSEKNSVFHHPFWFLSKNFFVSINFCLIQYIAMLRIGVWQNNSDRSANSKFSLSWVEIFWNGLQSATLSLLLSARIKFQEWLQLFCCCRWAKCLLLLSSLLKWTN